MPSSLPVMTKRPLLRCESLWQVWCTETRSIRNASHVLVTYKQSFVCHCFQHQVPSLLPTSSCQWLVAAEALVLAQVLVAAAAPLLLPRLLLLFQPPLFRFLASCADIMGLL